MSENIIKTEKITLDVENITLILHDLREKHTLQVLLAKLQINAYLIRTIDNNKKNI